MDKDKTIFAIIASVLFILFLGGGQLFSTVIDENTKVISWNGYETKITSSSGFVKRPCSGYPTEVAGYVSPMDDSNGTSLTLRAVSQINAGCAGDSSASVDITISNPESYSNIYFPVTGTASGSGKTEASLSISLSQEGGESVSLASFSSMYAGGGLRTTTGNPPSNLIISVDGHYLVLNLKNNNPLHLRLSVSTSHSNNNAGSQSSITLSPPIVSKKAVPVTPVVTTTPIQNQTNSTIATAISETVSDFINFINPFEEPTSESSGTTTQPVQSKPKSFTSIVIIVLILIGAVIFARWLKLI